uniref:Vacuolar protein sorting-associated protein 16 homolog n=1 Tax=Astatotilapia calliptera TaxID=8154 RepID=A0AAX7T5Q4_ASTCA
MAFITASWNPLGDAFYRSTDLYEMSWSLRDGLRDSLVAAAPYGGPIALLREPQRRSPSSRPQLEIYSASGGTVASFPWKSGPVVQLGWTVSDELLCIQEDGTVLIYDLFGSFKRHFSMGQEVVQSQVMEAKVFHSPYGTGIAIVTSSSRFTLATNIDDLKLRRLPEVPGLQGKPSCWVVLTQDRQTKVLLSNGPELFILDNTSCTVVCPPGLSPQDGNIVHMSVSFSYKYLALLTDSGHLWTGLSTLQVSRFSSDGCVTMVMNSLTSDLRFKQLTLQVLIDRLVYRQFYPLAIEVCRYLKIPDYQGVSRVLKHWASCKVQQKDLTDDAIARAVCMKVGDSPGVSYSDIAAKAYECGRAELAIKLLDFEARSGEQVPLLLKMKRSQLALSKAVESGDTDLGECFTGRSQPLQTGFCKLQEQETLKDLYNQDDDHQELANYYVTASYREKRLEGRLSLLQSAVDEYNKAKNEFAVKTTEDEMRLLRFQRKLDDEKGAGLLGLSLQVTMETLLSLGLHKQAEQLYKDFRVPDKRYWWLKLKSLAEKEEWDELEKFSKSKKSPIGYLAFVEVCIKCNNKYEAKKYVSKVTPEQKVKAHLAVGDLEGAADAAIERRNEAEIGAVLSRCSASNSLVIERLNRARAAIAKK